LRVSHPFFFLASLVWNFSLGMTWLVVPLYASTQGLSNSQIGFLFSLPIIGQVVINLIGGAYTDRIGGRRIMLASCWATVAGGLWFMVAEGFWMLMVGQSLLIVSRAAFWPASWAMASELQGERSITLGRLNAVTNTGQIAGSGLCGVFIASAGYDATFAVLAAMGLIAFLAGLGTRAPHRKAAASDRHVLAGFWPLLHRRIIHYSVLCAYLSALPFSLSVSFYPLLLAQFGYAEEASGVLLSLRAVGAIAAGLIAARFVRTGPQTLWPVGCGAVVAAAVGLMPLINHAVPIGLWMLIIGLGSGAMTLYFQITMAEASAPGERGSVMALGGMGWGLSHFTTPLVMGFLADRFGLIAGFYALAAFALAIAILIGFMRRWAFQKTIEATPIRPL
jgi:MFS family permease